MPKYTDITKLIESGLYSEDEIENLLAQQQQQSDRERKQRKQEKKTWRKKPKEDQ